MATYKLPAPSRLPSLSSSELTSVLDHLFEPCVPFHTLAVPLLHEKAFGTYDEVIATVKRQLTDLSRSTKESDKRWLEKILSAHPRLGEKNVKSDQSAAEQAQLRGSTSEARRLADLNISYEMTFPGLRYVVFVDGRDRNTIMQDMEVRIDRGDMKLERAEAIKAMCQIAADRSRKTAIEG